MLPCEIAPELFFTDFETPEDPTTVARAKLLCGTCPVMDACRHAARERREWGIWGGETQEERYQAGYYPALVPTDPDTPTVSLIRPKPLREDDKRLRRRSVCGTEQGYQWHQRNGTLDQADECGCRAAHSEHRKEKKAKKIKSDLCPSVSGYRQHIEKGEDPVPCGCARAQHDAERKREARKNRERAA